MNLAPCHATDPRQNHLLAALGDTDWAQWQPLLERVELHSGQVLREEAGSAPAHVYFPTTAIVSLLYMTMEGESAEIAVVGHEGVVGMSLIMGGNATPSQAVVQTGGSAYRLRAQAVKDEFGRSGPLLSMLLRYTQSLIVQVTQTAVCNRYHSIDQQFCRRLLLGLDRSASDELLMTQEVAASLLGVRREGVTAAALKLQQAGVIRYSRGRIAVLDRVRLEARSCECYAAAKKEYVRLLHNPARVVMPMQASAPLHPGSIPVPMPLPLRPLRPAPIPNLPKPIPVRSPPRYPAPYAA